MFRIPTLPCLPHTFILLRYDREAAVSKGNTFCAFSALCLCVFVTQLCLTLVNPWTVAWQGTLPWNSPGKNAGVGSHSIIQGFFLTQESNYDLYWRQILTIWATREHCLLFFLVIGGLVAKSYLTLVTPWTVACQAPLSMGFPRQEY